MNTYMKVRVPGVHGWHIVWYVDSGCWSLGSDSTSRDTDFRLRGCISDQIAVEFAAQILTKSVVREIAARAAALREEHAAGFHPRSPSCASSHTHTPEDARLDRVRERTAPFLNEFHRLNAARQHEVFAPPHSLTALVVCVQEEVGELAAATLGYTGEKARKAHLTRDDVLDAVADAMTYLSLVATAVGCEDLEALLRRTFNDVSRRSGSAIFISEGIEE